MDKRRTIDKNGETTEIKGMDCTLPSSLFTCMTSSFSFFSLRSRGFSGPVGLPAIASLKDEHEELEKRKKGIGGEILGKKAKDKA